MIESLQEHGYLKLEEEMDLDKGINEIIKSKNKDSFAKELSLQRAWEKIAPQKVLDHTDNVVYSKKYENSIIIFVDSPHCAADFSMSKEYYRQMMEHETGEEIENVIFIVSKKTGERKEFQKKEEKKPWYVDDCESIPLDEGELEYARQSVAGIEDEKLKETLFNAFVSDMEWKKGIKSKKTP